MRILITGGAGYLGSYIIHKLVETSNPTIITYDITTPNYPLHKKHEKEYTHINGDIRDKEKINQIIKDYRINTIIHLASPLTPLTEEYPPAIAEHLLSTTILLELAKQNSIDKVIYASSLAVYGENTKPCNSKEENIITEDTVPSPSTMYGHMKLLVEHLGSHYHRILQGSRFLAPRFGVVIGPGRKTGSTSIIIQLIKMLQNTKENDKIVVPTDPSTILYWIHPMDAAEIIAKLLKYEGSYTVFNAYSYAQKIESFLAELLELLNKQLIIEYIEMNPFRTPSYIISNRRIVQELEFTPVYDLRKTVMDVLSN